MRFTAGFFVAVILSVFMLTEIQCNKNPVKPGVTTYSYLNPIVNPPDTFKVAYNLNISGNLTAHITFQDSAVWRIQLLTQSLINYGFVNPANNSMIYIKSPDTVGYRGNIQYSFIANNNLDSLQTDLYFVKFTKLPLDYHTFPHRY